MVACDPSEEMVSRTLRRLARAGSDRATSVVPCGLEDLESYLEALGLPDTFHGIVSNFGALNCVAHLSPLAAVARRHLEPGGAVILGLMTRVCAFESLYFAATRRIAAGAPARAASGPVGVNVAGIEVPTYFHRIGDIRASARSRT